MTARESNLAIAAETTLSSALSSGATTINVTDSSSFPSVPFYVVIDPDVNASREVIYVDSSKTATTFVLSAASQRGLDGTADTAHSLGAKVAVVMVPGIIADLNDRIDAAYTAGGTDVAVDDGGTGASTAAGARTNLGAQAQSAVLDATTASFTIADETKLDGIEAGADVTDATNVAAAGAVMESDTTTAAMSFVVDEDDMVSNSVTKVPTQQSVKAYVDANAGGGTTLLTGFAYESGSLTTATQLPRVRATAANGAAAMTVPVITPASGSIVGLTVAMASARSGGSLVFEVYKNGTATGVTVTIDGTNTQYHYTTQAAGVDTFVAGDRLDVRGSNASFSPSSGMEAAIAVEFS